MDGQTSKGKNIENECIYHIIAITDVVNKNKRGCPLRAQETYFSDSTTMKV